MLIWSSGIVPRRFPGLEFCGSRYNAYDIRGCTDYVMRLNMCLVSWPSNRLWNETVVLRVNQFVIHDSCKDSFILLRCLI